MSEANNKLNIGKIIENGDVPRDAIHVAIYPAIAAIDLYPGQHVGVNEDGEAALGGTAIGVVDPFLMHKVPQRSRFWIFMYPGTVTNLRHNWDHAELPEAEPESVEEDYDDGCRGC